MERSAAEAVVFRQVRVGGWHLFVDVRFDVNAAHGAVDRLPVWFQPLRPHAFRREIERTAWPVLEEAVR
jgi:hypothetical protein